MSKNLRRSIVLAGVWAGLFSMATAAWAAGEQQLGRIVYSQAASLRGLAVPASGTVFSGDALATAGTGSAVVELTSGARLRIRENSSVRLLRDGDKVQAELLAGEVLSESGAHSALVVATAKFRFTPAPAEESQFAVALSPQQETVAAAMKGNLLISPAGGRGSYLLPAGKYASIPASSSELPAQESQEKTGGVVSASSQAGTVTNAIPAVLQHVGEGADSYVNTGDTLSVNSVVRTMTTGRLRIALAGGSTLNVAPLSALQITHLDAAGQQTEIELSQGLMRAEVAKLTKSGASFRVRTKTALVGANGNTIIVHALDNLTQVYCLEVVCTVQNADASTPGVVALHSGESSNVPVGLPPTVAAPIPPGLLESQIAQTEIAIPAATTARAAGGKKQPWHIGSLSPGASALLIVGLAGGAGAAAAVGLASGHGHSTSSSPSAP